MGLLLESARAARDPCKGLRLELTEIEDRDRSDAKSVV